MQPARDCEPGTRVTVYVDPKYPDERKMMWADVAPSRGDLWRWNLGHLQPVYAVRFKGYKSSPKAVDPVWA